MESTTITPTAARAVDAPTVTEALRRTAAVHPNLTAIRTIDDSVSLTWSQLLERVDATAGGLARLGLQRGSTVALMLSNRPEFHVVDLAAATVGAIPFSVYVTYPAEAVNYLLADAGAKIAIVEQAFLDLMLEACTGLPSLEHVIVVDGRMSADTVALRHLEESGRGFDGAAACKRIAPDDLLTLIYTSATTGEPKGVELSHRAVMAAARTVEEVIEIGPGARLISWLPAAHIAERMAHHYVPVVYAGTITCCPDPRQVVSYLPQVKPTWFFAVPRIWEKLKAGLEAMQAAQPEEQRRPVQESLQAAIERNRLRRRGEPVPEELEARVARADRELFSKVRAMLGLDEAVAINSGAAPTPVEVLEFFNALGIELAELWGMSETCGVGACNRPGELKIGTVGPPSPGSEIRIADDGEVLWRGPSSMSGYRNDPAKTRETIDAEGWLHTGDIGRLDEDGYLTIVDRKKEIIINTAGKNMSPPNIEARLKVSSRLIGQVCAIGDGRPYNTALVVLDPDFAPHWAGLQGIEGATFEELAAEPKLVAAVQEAVDEANRHLARVEQIKRFTIVSADWPPGGDELTPTMK
ncbi:MAG: long-chain fatty acid--CoA ligase, partial [Solirubrobacterales bacterium]|nr:long-chain fatty acid--CoA ligase [Solirubrobacterales bacterium]